MIPGIIAGVVLAAALGIYLWRRTRRRRLRQLYWEHKGRFYHYSLQQLENGISEVGRRKRELEHRLEIFAKANPKVHITLSDELDFDVDSIEAQMRSITWDLEELDRQEEILKEVIADKRAGRDYSNLFQ